MIKLRVKDILKEKGITQKELADTLGITEVGLSKSLSDKGNPTIATLENIANALSVDMTDLFEKQPQKGDSELKCPNCGAELEIKKKE